VKATVVRGAPTSRDVWRSRSSSNRETGWLSELSFAFLSSPTSPLVPFTARRKSPLVDWLGMYAYRLLKAAEGVPMIR